jgi:hypothetical protein
LRIISVFDVALVVRFTPFTELAHWVESIPYTVKGLSPEALAVKGFEEDIKAFVISEQILQPKTKTKEKR